jgi:hypothetical protein
LRFDDIPKTDQKNLRPFFVTRGEIFRRLFGIIQFSA